MRNDASFAARAQASLAALAVAMSAAGCAGAPESPSGRESFDSPEAAILALVGALRADDDAAVEQVLGAEGRELIDSGDPVADRNNVAEFLAAFDRRHAIVCESGSQATLVVGEDEWALPIPVVARGASWHFDTERGLEEIRARRIGDNELAVMHTCRAIVDAQQEFAEAAAASGGERAYARKLVSTPGARDGLYWETAPGEPESPLGPLVADAVAEGYSNPSREERPFHGYYFRLLTAQGESAPGGARSYLEGERMTGGFAVVAWPAAYGTSGIMTFLVSDDGVVYEKDLGEKTARAASEMSMFDPGEGWEVVPALD